MIRLAAPRKPEHFRKKNDERENRSFQTPRKVVVSVFANWAIS